MIQGYGGRLDNWRAVLKDVKATPGVTHASPLIEQPLLATFNGRVDRSSRAATPARTSPARPQGELGSLGRLQPDAGNVAIGSQLAANLGARVGDTITIINPQGRATPFGTVPRQVAYRSRGDLRGRGL